MKMRNFYISVIAVVICLLVTRCTTQTEQVEVPEIMGELPLGTYAVGYRTIFTYDETRPGLSYSDWDGKLYRDHDPSLGRQFQIHLWYPAEKGSGQPFNFREYVHLMGRQTNFRTSLEQNQFGEERFIQQTNDLGGEGNFSALHLDQLMELPVFAQHEASALDGPFPVVIFPNGSPGAYHSITAEFLASHGFVVVGFSPKGRFSWGMEISTVGLETAVEDLEFVLQKLVWYPFIDLREISLAGNAISSSVCALAMARNSQFKGLISLEGGLPSAFEQRLLKASAIYEPQNLQSPMLFIYAPHPSIDPIHTFHLIHANRYYVHFPRMSEFAMLNYGMFDAFVPDVIGAHEVGTQKGFETANQLMLRFLNKIHKKTDEPLFSRDFMAHHRSSIDTTFQHEAIPAAPNMAQLKNLFLEGGMSAIDSVYQRLEVMGNEKPFYPSFYQDYRGWLAWKRDPEYTNRLRLYQLAYRSFPESSEVNYYLGAYLERTGDHQGAEIRYKRTLELLNNDRELSMERKTQIQHYTEESLKTIQ